MVEVVLDYPGALLHRERYREDNMKPWAISMRYLNFMIGCVAVLCIGFFIVLFWLAVHDDSAWTKFALKHHCSEIVSYDSDAVDTDFDALRSGVTNHRRSAYLCDDGITYIKAD